MKTDGASQRRNRTSKYGNCNDISLFEVIFNRSLLCCGYMQFFLLLTQYLIQNGFSMRYSARVRTISILTHPLTYTGHFSSISAASFIISASSNLLSIPIRYFTSISIPSTFSYFCSPDFQSLVAIPI